MLSSLTLIALGLLLALAGRRFIWLLIGVAGFVLGYTLVTFIMPGQDEVFQLVVGVLGGLIGAFFAKRFTRLLLMVAGFILVGNLVLAVGRLFGVDNLLIELLLFAIGGIVGLALVRFAFGTALILISALGGASMVMQGMPGLFDTAPGTLNLVIGVVVAAAGFIVQWRFFNDTK